MKKEIWIDEEEFMANRYFCTVIDEMRSCYKTRNFSIVMGLLEELQSIGNRMEAKCGDINDANRYLDDVRNLKREIKSLKRNRDKLNRKIEKLNRKIENDDEE
jgi:peptidoglycan hydrolase CwlO-like protein